MYNDFVIEVPQLANLFDEDALWQACQTNPNHDNKNYGVKCWEVKPDQPEVEHIFKIINQDKLSQPLIGWLMYKYKDESLKPHVDVVEMLFLCFLSNQKITKFLFWITKRI